MTFPQRVFSGARPSGRQHLGNYMGAIRNYVALQEEFDECLYCAVDVHALTTMTSKEETGEIQQNIREMVLDWLAAGLNPEKSIIFVQSHVPEVMTLHTLLSMVTPMGWLMRVPTFKDKVRQMQATDESVPYGLVGYPVLMTADIILYKAEVVPVGEDQLPHLELSREIVRRFNNMFGPVFPEPLARLTESPMIFGTDGQAKMSKTMNNHIELAATDDETAAKVKTMVTDPQRARRTDPGRPWVCNVYKLHHWFNPGKLDDVYRECTAAGIGCVDDKKLLAEGVNGFFSDFRERRQEFAARDGYIEEVLLDGANRAGAIAKETIREVEESMGLRLKGS